MSDPGAGDSANPKKDGGSGEDATKSGDQREQMDGGNLKKVEAAKREGQNSNIGLEYREKVHENIQRKVRIFDLDRAQTEEGGNGGPVQQRGQGRMVMCSRCGEDHR